MAVSHAIAALEARHETKLFDRIGRRIALTEAGRVFLMEVRAVLARAGAAELALNSLLKNLEMESFFGRLPGFAGYTEALSVPRRNPAAYASRSPAMLMRG